MNVRENIGRIKNIRRTKDPKKALLKAADLLDKEPERWVKGYWAVNPKGKSADPVEYFEASCEIGGVCKVCLEGAVMIFSKNENVYQEAIDRVKDVLNDQMPFDFNDRTARSSTEIVDVLRKAAQG